MYLYINIIYFLSLILKNKFLYFIFIDQYLFQFDQSGLYNSFHSSIYVIILIFSLSAISQTKSLTFFSYFSNIFPILTFENFE